MRVLNMYNISFEKEKTFEGCIYKKQLRFDFYLPDYNTCIEFDGEQHFTRGFNTTDCEFDELKYRDSIKDEYCYKNDLNIIRIPYWDFDNIEKIITEIIR